VRAKPRARASRILRADGLSLDVALAAPPADGAANEELLAVLADALSVPRRSLHLALGGASKHKVVDVLGLGEADVIRRLAEAVARGR
jgi:uncharacterized protein YggU (UPF0235/DUF167 family)